MGLGLQGSGGGGGQSNVDGDAIEFCHSDDDCFPLSVVGCLK